MMEYKLKILGLWKGPMKIVEILGLDAIETTRMSVLLFIPIGYAWSIPGLELAKAELRK